MPSSSEQKISALFELDGEGIMKDKLTGARVFVMSRNGWRAFYEELEGTFFSQAPLIFERIGYAYGKLIGRAAKRLEMDTVRTFEALFELGMGAGWGVMSLSGGDLAQGLGILKVEHCVFCEGLVNRKADNCHFLPGVVRGVADEVTGRSHQVNEKRCVLKGDPACEIHLGVLE